MNMSKWFRSFTVFTFQGIPLKIHTSLLLFLLGMFCIYGSKEWLVFLMGFISIIPHEYGHALCAKYFGIKTKEIIMTPIGGAAFLERMPREPHMELAITAAGPAVTLALAILSLPFAFLFPCLLTVGFTAVNIILFLFNALPLLPMDGGRILRSTLAFFMDYVAATTVCVRISQTLSIILAIVGVIFGFWMLTFTMLIVFWFSGLELKAAMLPSPKARALRTSGK